VATVVSLEKNEGKDGPLGNGQSETRELLWKFV